MPQLQAVDAQANLIRSLCFHGSERSHANRYVKNEAKGWVNPPPSHTKKDYCRYIQALLTPYLGAITVA